MLDNNGTGLTILSILDILDKLYQSFSQRGDLLPGPQKILYYLSMDFALFLGMFNNNGMLRVIKIYNRGISRFQLRTELIFSRKRSRTN